MMREEREREGEDKMLERKKSPCKSREEPSLPPSHPIACVGKQPRERKRLFCLPCAMAPNGSSCCCNLGRRTNERRKPWHIQALSPDAYTRRRTDGRAYLSCARACLVLFSIIARNKSGRSIRLRRVQIRQ